MSVMTCFDASQKRRPAPLRVVFKDEVKPVSLRVPPGPLLFQYFMSNSQITVSE